MFIIPDFDNILLFVGAATLLIVVPGPAVLYIMAKSIEHGYRAGVASVVGVGIGAFVHVIAASIGISAILVASATAFSVVKYLGAFYLIYLGIKKLTEKTTTVQKEEVIDHRKKQLSSIIYEGVVVNILNPKAAIFFFAFLPQFVNLDKGGATSQIMFLGFLFILIAVVSDSLYVALSGYLSAKLKNNKTFIKTQKYFMGPVYILLGVLTLTVNQPINKK